MQYELLSLCIIYYAPPPLIAIIMAVKQVSVSSKTGIGHVLN